MTVVLGLFASLLTVLAICAVRMLFIHERKYGVDYKALHNEHENLKVQIQSLKKYLNGIDTRWYTSFSSLLYPEIENETLKDIKDRVDTLCHAAQTADRELDRLKDLNHLIESREISLKRVVAELKKQLEEQETNNKEQCNSKEQ